MTDGNVFPYFAGLTSGCSWLTPIYCLPDEKLNIGVAGFLYDFGCSRHSAEFDFGDGSEKVVVEGRSAPTVEHRYTAPAVYTLRVTLRNNRGSITLVQTIPVANDVFPAQ